MTETGFYADDNHKHFSGGQTEAMIELPAGTHMLQSVLGDLDHAPLNPPVKFKQITTMVTEKRSSFSGHAKRSAALARDRFRSIQRTRRVRATFAVRRRVVMRTVTL